MISPYKRRKPSIVRNFWIYRRIVGLAMVLGLLLWFIWANNAPVTVSFPFRLGTLESTTGWVILLSALVGSATTALAVTVLLAYRRIKGSRERPYDEAEQPLSEDRPPAGYAAKASEAGPDDRW
jgi:uncharacterized integral membrane protein